MQRESDTDTSVLLSDFTQEFMPSLKQVCITERVVFQDDAKASVSPGSSQSSVVGKALHSAPLVLSALDVFLPFAEKSFYKEF